MRAFRSFGAFLTPLLVPTLLVLALDPAHGADGDLAILASGEADVAGVPLAVGAGIPAGTVVHAGEKPLRLTLVKAPKSALILAPDSSLSVTEKDGGFQVQLESGIVQANIADKGPYSDLHVLGAALDVRVTGTLFMVQRVKADTDYVSLIEGRVKVSLREQVALALGKTVPPVELSGRQGLGAGVGGFGGIQVLVGRPQIPTTTVATRAASIASVTPGSGSSDWSHDEGMASTGSGTTGSGESGTKGTTKSANSSGSGSSSSGSSSSDSSSSSSSSGTGDSSGSGSGTGNSASSGGSSSGAGGSTGGSTPGGSTGSPGGSPGAGAPPPVAPPVSVATNQIQSSVGEQVRNSVSSAVSKEVSQQVKTSIQSEVVNSVVNQITELGRPPGPPSSSK